MFTGKGFASFVPAKVFAEVINNIVKDASSIRFSLDGIEAFFEVVGDLFDLVSVVVWDAMIAGVKTYAFLKGEV